ncbi:MAG: SDR family oxidoreductase [Gemmatimonadota bacterium]|nr:SDR family oxidoreductase [Gemmatimonadota bacterium]
MENQDHSHAAPVYEPQEIARRTVVISGGTTGIGRATARLLTAHGARVLIFGRHEEELNEALEEIRGAGGEVYGLTADQSGLEDVQRVFEEADRRLGELDILINNAAVSPDSLLEGEPEELRYAIETNLGGPIACTREAAQRMQRRGEGHIVNVGSMSADLREEENSVYVATKDALQGFSESLRKTLNPEGIKVALVEPGKVATDMVDMSKRKKEKKEKELEMLRPEDIAACVYFCLIQPKRCDVVVMQVRPHLQTI